MVPIYPQPVSGQIYRFQQRVSYALCTVGNHVYHSRFLDVLEIARGEFLRALGHTFASWQERDTIFPVIECQLSFKGPARYDDVLTVELWLTEAKGIRLTFACRISSGETTISTFSYSQSAFATSAHCPRTSSSGMPESVSTP